MKESFENKDFQQEYCNNKSNRESLMRLEITCRKRIFYCLLESDIVKQQHLQGITCLEMD